MTDSPASFDIVFVCTGNICRSPMAEVMGRAAFAAAGLGESVRVRSAGTGGWHAGAGMDPRAAAELATLDLPGDHTAQQVSGELLEADLLIALDQGHERFLRHEGVPGERLRLLRSFDPDAHGLDCADPYYGSQRDFAQVRTEIAASLPGLVDYVREQLAH